MKPLSNSLRPSSRRVARALLACALLRLLSTAQATDPAVDAATRPTTAPNPAMPGAPVPVPPTRLGMFDSGSPCGPGAAITEAGGSSPSPPRGRRARIGLVLGGGGARGVSEVGVLQALELLHIPVDVVVGTSMGAIVGGAYSIGIAPTEMEQRLQHVAWDEVVSDNVPRSQRSVLSKEQERDNIRGVELGFRDNRVRLPKGAVTGHEFELFLGSLLGSAPVLRTFDDLPIPYRAVATDIENGAMVILGDGDLIGAIRASMAVPGVFSPVEVNGRLLVDGGLIRNIPVDVARAMGAEQLIVVDVGSPLLKRDEINSVISIGQQMLNIMGHQNVAASLCQLRPQDVLIKVDLGSFSVADFEHSPSTIDAGRRSALAQSAALEGLRLPEDAWQAHLAARRARRDEPEERRVLRIDASQLSRVNPRSVQALMDGREGQPISQSTLEQDLTRLYATDDFQQIRTRVVSEADGTTAVVVQPIEKEWGPNYVNVDLDLATDLQGNSRFSTRVATRSTWLDRRGLEWRNTFSLGAINQWASELYQPLDFSRNVFIAPRLELHQERDDLYQQDTPVTTYRINRRLFGLDLGARFGTSALIRIGVEGGGITATPALAQSVFPALSEHVGAYHLKFDYDTLDRWSFPSTGQYLKLDLKSSRSVLGANTSYDRGDLQFEQAFHFGDEDLRVGLAGGSGFGTRLPVQDLFPLGGFLQLSGYQQRQFLGQRYLLGRLMTYRSLGDPGAYTRRLFLGASLEAGNVYDRFNGSNSSGLRHSGSIFLGADTGIGPLFLGLGVAGNSRSAYLFLGRP
jgi:NTE family protein